jgi:nicotinate-nucleotide adenylyltransferase
MLRLAVAEESRFQVSEIEAQLTPPSYTIDTLALLLGTKKTQAEYYFIIGSDAFFDIRLWHEYQQVLAKVHLIIAARQGTQQPELQDFIRSLGYEGQGDSWHNTDNGTKIVLLDREVVPASSSAIRNNARCGESSFEDVPSAVKQYMQKYKLYCREEE